MTKKPLKFSGFLLLFELTTIVIDTQHVCIAVD